MLWLSTVALTLNSSCSIVRHAYQESGCCGYPENSVSHDKFVVQGVHLDVHNPWPPRFPVLRTQLDDFMDLVHNLTNGYLTLTSKFGFADVIQTAVAEKQAYSFADYYAGIPELVYLTSFPTILPSAEAFAAWRTSKRGREIVRGIMESMGVWSCTMQDTTRQDAYILTPNTTLPTTLEELHGFRMRVPGGGGVIFSRLGATILSISGGALIGAINDKSVDMVEWLGMTNFDAMGFQNIDGITLVTPGLHEQHGALSFGMELGVYNALPGDVKLKLDAACDAQLSRSISESVYNNAQINEKHKDIPRTKWSDTIIRAYEMEARKYIDERLKSNHASVAEKELLRDMLRFDAMWRSLKNEQVYASEFTQFPPLPPHVPPSPPAPPPVPHRPPSPPRTPSPPTHPASPTAPPAPPHTTPTPPGIPTWK